MPIRFATKPIPSQITKMPSRTGAVRLASNRMWSRLRERGSIESPSTVIIRRRPGLARSSWRRRESANTRPLAFSNSSFQAPGR